MREIEERIIRKYANVRKLEDETSEEGERNAARSVRENLEKKHPGLVEAYVYYLKAQENQQMDPHASDPSWDWRTMAEMAGDFFSHMKDYTEFAFGIAYARKLAAKAKLSVRNNPTGSMTINFKVDALDLDTLEMMTDEQKTAYIVESVDMFEETISEYISVYL